MGGPIRASVTLHRALPIVLILALALSGCDAGATDSATVQPTPTGTDEPAVTAAPTPSQDTAVAPPGTVEFDAISLKGKGKKTVKFKIPGDASALAQASHAGTGKFAITSVAADGSPNDLMVNTTGKYKGTVLFDAGIDQHSVAFKVDASGSWTIVVKPVSGARKWNGSGTLKGTGDDVVQIAPALSGPLTVDLTFKGKRDFAVTSYAPDGGKLLAKEIGNFTGQVLLPEGSFLLAIKANGGTWSAAPG